ncbi:MAG: type III-B CRISPR module-associated protein Cmr5 [Candidatus Dadabacteria bacterium]|nr:MAG: type III-B CRISPR module-associated protein Cmr5 [Candidatus Dadabacteria bacterium]
MKRLEQIRAGFAWEKVNEVKGRGGFDEYVGLVKKMPALIGTNGLGQALAFLVQKAGLDQNGRIKGDKPHGWLFEHIEAWLRAEERPHRGPFHGSGRDNVLVDLMESDSATYLRATADAVGFLNYLRLFAAGLGKEKGNHGAEG